MAAKILVGTCGFCLAQRKYYATFPVIEIQQTFYQPPSEAQVQKWREAAPPGFEFTLKAFQAITHPPSSPTWRRSRLAVEERQHAGYFGNTPVVRRAWETTRQLAEILRATIVVFQCPPRFDARQEHVRNLRWFFHWAERGSLKFGLEIRHPSWSDALLRQLCEELELIHVVDPFTRATVTPRLKYYRLHGIGGYDYQYTDADLQRLCGWCRGRRVYCMFNNTFMLEDALRFRQLLETLA
ncbi:MAG: DUF72 domain-containing protein [Gemmatales bacterium]|nr:DUF72 domain-containing protein [Gemmatales bacterium]MCS7160572.1 DUF72 domain-containing protein [Gemmatales bacterium]MDW8175773.1 DUF72 domain-containing protein [Gemmatales bacterium]MDW8222437.1 DUF72 domain-containing protein [Gemmatales bacterium]